MKAVIMAGGYGKRIAELFPDIPKPLIPIEGKTVLERQIEVLKQQCITDIILTVSYEKEQIKKTFGDGAQFGVRIHYFEEEKPLGNAGALFYLKNELEDDFLLLNADTVFEVDLNRIIKYHKEKRAEITLFTHPNSHPYDSGIVIADKNRKVTGWLTKEESRPTYYKNRVNAGIHVISPKVLSSIDFDKNGKIDLDRNVIRPKIKDGKVFCYESPEYVRDMGTPKRYAEVCDDIKHHRITKTTEQRKAIFLDRDGTINKTNGFICSPNDFELLPMVSDAIRLINRSGLLAVVVTNQPVLARGEVTENGLDEIHNKLETLLGNDGAYLDAIYYCPHHPDSGFEGEIPELKIQCECRKPKPGLLVEASKDFNIDLEQSWMIGDSWRDVEAGKAARCKTVLIGSEDLHQDITAESLYEAVVKIIGEK